MDFSDDSNRIVYKEVVLARLGEIALKGMNRGKFEGQLMRNIKWRLRDLGKFEINQSQSRIWISNNDQDIDLSLVMDRVCKVFGLVSVSPVRKFKGDLTEIGRQSIAYIADLLSDGKARSFKVESKRGNKLFPYNSPQISNEIGGLLLNTFPDLLTVDVHNPDFTFYVEVRDYIYIYHTVIKAQKGLPVGMGGKGMLLLSGGIDSPVAGYMMSSRGMQIEAVYFHAFPFTSNQAKEKVVDLARLLTPFTGALRLHVVNFTEIQLQIRDHCPEDMITIVMRRMMMRIAEKLAEKHNCKALITGESLGQVASQTLEALCTTDSVVARPVFRPLIGMDKDDTVQIARRIGTFETSILPYEDCCTVFVAKHPKTHPSLLHASDAESSLDIDELVNCGLMDIEVIEL
jgi:thiamine biosynthesis protein ThiI